MVISKFTNSFDYIFPSNEEDNELLEVAYVMGLNPEAKSNKFKGFVSHYHLTDRKIDCAGLDIKKMLEEIK